MAKLDDLTGKKFGRLTAVGPYFRRQSKTVWPCQCECGNQVDIPATNLKVGNTKSCGCYRREFTTERNTTHGLGKPPEYLVWCLMRRRCTDPTLPEWGGYGGRGITVCPQWESFENFYADMGPRPSPDHQLDRRDNMQGYAPGNCHWTTRIENCNNRRDNVIVEWRGERQTVSQWARRIGMSHETLWARLFKLRWDVERALTTPVRQQRPRAA